MAEHTEHARAPKCFSVQVSVEMFWMLSHSLSSLTTRLPKGRELQARGVYLLTPLSAAPAALVTH